MLSIQFFFLFVIFNIMRVSTHKSYQQQFCRLTLHYPWQYCEHLPPLTQSHHYYDQQWMAGHNTVTQSFVCNNGFMWQLFLLNWSNLVQSRHNLNEVTGSVKFSHKFFFVHVAHIIPELTMFHWPSLGSDSGRSFTAVI